MIVPINKISAQVPVLSGDIYVADYTNQTNSVRRLEILSTPPTDIAYYIYIIGSVYKYIVSISRNILPIQREVRCVNVCLHQSLPIINHGCC